MSLDKIILGLLMLKRLTVYEIRGIIRKNFKAMCSDSLGSIQAAIKRLLAEQLITCQEYVEKSVNKKQYSITAEGRKVFSGWVHTPAEISNPKNIELGKLLFMGLVPIENRLSLVVESIALMEKELDELRAIQQSAAAQQEGEDQMVAYWNNDAEYAQGVRDATETAKIEESARDIGDFQMLALQYGIDVTRFQIEWYRKLERRIIEATQKEKTK